MSVKAGSERNEVEIISNHVGLSWRSKETGYSNIPQNFNPEVLVECRSGSGCQRP